MNQKMSIYVKTPPDFYYFYYFNILLLFCGFWEGPELAMGSGGRRMRLNCKSLLCVSCPHCGLPGMLQVKLPLLETSRNFRWFHQIQESWQDCVCWVEWETERKSTYSMGYGVSFLSPPSCVNQRYLKASFLIPFPPLSLVSTLISTAMCLEESSPPPFEMPTPNLGNHTSLVLF